MNGKLKYYCSIYPYISLYWWRKKNQKNVNALKSSVALAVVLTLQNTYNCLSLWVKSIYWKNTKLNWPELKLKTTQKIVQTHVCDWWLVTKYDHLIASVGNELELLILVGCLDPLPENRNRTQSKFNNKDTSIAPSAYFSSIFHYAQYTNISIVLIVLAVNYNPRNKMSTMSIINVDS